MAPKSSHALAELLRVSFLTLEHADGSARDQADLARVKHATLKRLADYEAELAIIDSLARSLEKTEPSELPDMMSKLVIEDLQALEEATRDIPPHELD